MSFQNFDMDDFIDEIIYENDILNKSMDDFINENILGEYKYKIQNYHGVRGHQSTRVTHEYEGYTDEILDELDRLEKLKEEEIKSGRLDIEMDKLFYDLLIDIELPEVEKEIKDFLEYKNERGKLYYLHIVLDYSEGDRFYETKLRVFGKINKEVFNFLSKFNNSRMFDFHDYSKKDYSEDILYKISELFRFKKILENLISARPRWTIKELRPSTGDEKIDYAYRTIKNNPLDNKQITFINPETTRFIKFGKICSDEFYLKNGCMISCFLEIFYKRLNNSVRNCKDLEISNLYKMATGLEFISGKDDYGITLKQATKWCDRFQFEMMTIDINGKIIFQYSPKIINKKITGGHLWRILIHSGHVFNITENIKEFDRLHSRKTFSEPELKSALQTDIELKSKNWPKLKTYEARNYEHIKNYGEMILSNYNEFLTRDADSLFKECVFNNTEPSNIKLNNGSILSFDVMIYSFSDKTNNSDTKICKVHSIDNFSILSNQPYDINMIIDKYQQLKFDKYLHELRQILTPNTAISYYSNSLYNAFKSY